MYLREESLSDNHCAGQDEQGFRRIIEECDYLMQMIDTMLDVSEAEAGAATLDMREIDMAALCETPMSFFIL